MTPFFRLRRSAPAALALALAAVLAGCGSAPRVASPVSAAPTVQEAPPQGPVKADALKRAKLHTELASLYYSEGNMAVALDEIRQALDASSTYAQAYNVKGLIHLFLGEHGEAEASFQQALSLSRNDPEINNNYGYFLCQTGRARQSLQYFLIAVKDPLYPTPDWAYLNAGQCAARMGDDALALQYIERSYRLGPNNPATMLELANLRLKRGEARQARQLLMDMNRLQEPGPQALWLGVRIERALGDRSAEMSYATQLRRRFPDSPEAQEMKGEGR
ncbi:MAG: type IV pilus biogenesis/stability protein PilW [Azospira sp.]